jgi:hypothetical protein
VRKTAFFIIGAIIGIAICWLLAYIGSQIVVYMGIQLYASEADQQRNFNIFIVANFVFAIVGGYFLSRRKAQR